MTQIFDFGVALQPMWRVRTPRAQAQFFSFKFIVNSCFRTSGAGSQRRNWSGVLRFVECRSFAASVGHGLIDGASAMFERIPNAAELVAAHGGAAFREIIQIGVFAGNLFVLWRSTKGAAIHHAVARRNSSQIDLASSSQRASGPVCSSNKFI